VQKALGDGNAKFVLFPGVSASSKYVAMGAANSFDVPAKAKNAATAVYFLNWLHTNKAARQIVTNISGASPGGDPTEAQPTVAKGSLIAQALTASAQVGKDNGFVDFIANTTAGIYAGSLQPEEQQLLVSKTTPQQFVTAVQAYYANEIKG
jgi:raffinose/stachyose/melibiose transport system substrate-binding protein